VLKQIGHYNQLEDLLNNRTKYSWGKKNLFFDQPKILTGVLKQKIVYSNEREQIKFTYNHHCP
jgi:hypothetical protein